MIYVPDSLATLRGAPALYDKLAPAYSTLHRRWMRVGGAQAAAAVEGCIAGDLRPGAKILDAGCGPGALARRIHALEPTCQLTLVDAAPGMLRMAEDVPGERILADLRALPFDDEMFDIVISTWVLETLGDDRMVALGELDRVLKPGGLLCYCACTKPTSPLRRACSKPTRLAIERFFYGCFLAADDLPAPPHGCTHRMTFHGGLSAAVVHRKAS